MDQRNVLGVLLVGGTREMVARGFLWIVEIFRTHRIRTFDTRAGGGPEKRAASFTAVSKVRP